MKIVLLNNKNLKVLFFALLCIFCFASIFHLSINYASAEKYSNVECKDYKNFILAFMNPYVYDALEKHFGYQKNFDLFQIEIVDIIDGTYKGYYFDITLFVTSYLGAHLSDFSQNKLTFRLNDNGIHLTNFE